MKYIFTTVIISCLCLKGICQGISGKPKAYAGASVSFSPVNMYAVEPNGKVIFGVNGISLGGFYRTELTKYTFQVGILGGFPPSPESYHYHLHSEFAEAAVHITIYNKLKGIAGLNYVNYKYDDYYVTNYNNGTFESVKIFGDDNSTFGLTVGIEYQFNNCFSLAWMCRPAIISERKTTSFISSLQINIDLNFWKIR